MSDTYRFTATLWTTASMTWVFVTVPQELSDEIRALPRPPKPGFGSIRVNATVGESRWSTSIFPDSKSGCYLLPVKKTIRVAEGADVDDVVDVQLELNEELTHGA